MFLMDGRAEETFLKGRSAGVVQRLNHVLLGSLHLNKHSKNPKNRSGDWGDN